MRQTVFIRKWLFSPVRQAKILILKIHACIPAVKIFALLELEKT